MKKVLHFIIFIFLINNSHFSQTTIFEDPLIGGTSHGTLVGGSFTSEGYKPGKGTGHILYKLPYEVPNGYLEFQIKGFTAAAIEDPEGDADNGFFGMYDGRGITEPIMYFDDFKTNFFRWNFHYRQNKNAFKSVIQCSAPTPERLNATKAVFGYDSEGLIAKDWGEEPTGINYITNSTTWYTVKAEWKNKKFTISINGTAVWSVTDGIYDYVPKDHKIWLGSAPGVGDKYTNSVPGLTYRNLKVVTYGTVVAPDTLNISPQNQNVSFSSGQVDFIIESNVNWSVSENSDWISSSVVSGIDNGSFTINYLENNLEIDREAIITVSGGNITRNIKITQVGKPASYLELLSPDSINVDFHSGDFILNIESNTNWSLSSNVDWITISPSDSFGNASIAISYLKNNSNAERIAIITLSNDVIIRTLKIKQTGADFYISINPSFWEVSNKAGSVSFYIESNQTWTINNSNNWIVPSISGADGDASILINFHVNTDTSKRVGTIYIVSENIQDSLKIIQNGASPVEIIGTSNPINGGTIVGAGIYGEGAQANIKAIANDGWKFDNWTDNSIVISSDSVLTFKVSVQKEIVANFSPLTDIDFDKIPEEYGLFQNYPNPFNPSTSISFSLPENSKVVLNVYNLLGQKLLEISNKNYNAGNHSINFDGKDLASGIYLYSIQAVGISGKNYQNTRKMILMK
ncbi:MAG: T9SS type A sorting domain-containing protein [Ignavibacteriae bacterium]|nr:T9SS type A sorting domain-containing protein [Ignavibacteriota bacterium]